MVERGLIGITKEFLITQEILSVLGTLCQELETKPKHMYYTIDVKAF